MKKLITYTGAAVAAIGFTSLSAVADHHGEKKMTKEEKEMKMEKMKEMTVAEIAMKKKKFSTLVAAIQAAGLADALNGDGPFTVFAPTNKAFEKLPEGTVEMLLKPENKEKLASILKYHVISGKVMAADVKPMMAKTLEGSEFKVSVSDGTVMVDNAKVVKTDIVGKNGVIHVIDTVIMPKK